jgi:putative Holliday junction resolvase
MRIMCLDIGTKTIGIAVSDELGITAQPLKTLSRKTEEEDIEALKRLIGELKVTEVVVGLPKRTDGSLGQAAISVLEFAEKLKSAIPQPIHTWDERFSTVAVTRTLLAGDASRAKRKKVVNHLAAAYILQGFLDSR